MSENRDEKLDQLLRSRRSGSCRVPTWPQRIILQGADSCRKCKTYFAVAVGCVSCSPNFICPSPATCSPARWFSGMVIGFSTPPDS